MTNLSPLDQALHDADDKEIADALRYLGRAERIAAALNAAPQPQAERDAFKWAMLAAANKENNNG